MPLMVERKKKRKREKEKQVGGNERDIPYDRLYHVVANERTYTSNLPDQMLTFILKPSNSMR